MQKVSRLFAIVAVILSCSVGAQELEAVQAKIKAAKSELSAVRKELGAMQSKLNKEDEAVTAKLKEIRESFAAANEKRTALLLESSEEYKAQYDVMQAKAAELKTLSKEKNKTPEMKEQLDALKKEKSQAWKALRDTESKFLKENPEVKTQIKALNEEKHDLEKAKIAFLCEQSAEYKAKWDEMIEKKEALGQLEKEKREAKKALAGDKK